MILFFVSILIISFGIISLLINKKFYDLMFLYAVLWGGVVFLASFKAYGMREYSVRTVGYILCGIVSYAFGWWVANNVPRIVIRKIKMNRMSVSNNTREKIIKIIMLITFAWYIFFSIRTTLLLVNGSSYIQIRNMNQGYTEELLFKSGIENLFQSLIFSPISTASFIIMATYFMAAKKHLDLFLLSLVTNLLKAYAVASRFTLLYCVIVLLVLMGIFKKFISKGLMRNLKILMSITIVFFVLITFFRGYSAKSYFLSFIKTIYIYMASPVPMFDYCISNYFKEFKYGKMFFMGILDLIDSIISYSGIPIDLTSDIKTIVSETERFVRLYQTNYFNAFASIFYYFYVDFGVIGIIIFNAIYGYISRIVFNNVLYRGRILDVAILIYFVQMVTQTIVRWPFSMLSNIMVFLYLYWISKFMDTD